MYLLHVYSGLPSPLDNHAIMRVLNGVKRIEKDVPCSRPIITTDIHVLKEIWGLLDMNQSLDATFSAVCLIVFFNMLRISSLFPPSPNTLCLSSAIVYKVGIHVVLRCKYSKTAQFLDHEPYVSSQWNKDAALCPATTLL